MRRQIVFSWLDIALLVAVWAAFLVVLGFILSVMYRLVTFGFGLLP
jgi:hypothetical protein